MALALAEPGLGWNWRGWFAEFDACGLEEFESWRRREGGGGGGGEEVAALAEAASVRDF